MVKPDEARHSAGKSPRSAPRAARGFSRNTGRLRCTNGRAVATCSLAGDDTRTGSGMKASACCGLVTTSSAPSGRATPVPARWRQTAMRAWGSSARVLRRWRRPMLPRLMHRILGLIGLIGRPGSAEIGPEDGFIVLLVMAQGQAQDFLDLEGFDGAARPGALDAQHGCGDRRAGLDGRHGADHAFADQRAVIDFRRRRALDAIAQAGAGLAHGGHEGPELGDVQRALVVRAWQVFD